MQKKPQPLTPPEGSKASVYSSSQQLPQTATEAVRVPVAAPVVRHVATNTTQAHQTLLPKKKKKPYTSQIAVSAVIITLIAGVIWVVFSLSSKRRDAALFQEMVSYAAKGDATELPVNSDKLDLLLNAATDPSLVEFRQSVCKALYLAKAADSTEIDKRIAEFTTTKEMTPDIRETLIRDVVMKRNNPIALPYLLNFLSSPLQDARSSVAALQAIRAMASLEQMDALLSVLIANENEDVTKTVGETLDEIIKKAPDRSVISARLTSMYGQVTNDSARFALLRLIGRCGGTNAAVLIQTLLDDAEVKNKVAAIFALGSWADDSGATMLIDFISKTDQIELRNRAFDSALRLLSTPGVSISPLALPRHWKQLSAEAKTSEEQNKIIRGLAKNPEDWSVEIIKPYKNSDEDHIAELAAIVLDGIDEMRRINGVQTVVPETISTSEAYFTNLSYSPTAPEVKEWSGFASDVLAYTDRASLWKDVPPALVGGHYLRLRQTDKTNASLGVTFDAPVNSTVYVLVDNRVGDGIGGSNPVTAQIVSALPWLAAEGFLDSGLDVGMEEFGFSAPGIDNTYSVFFKQVGAEDTPENRNFVLGSLDISSPSIQSRGVYGVVITKP